MSFYHEYSLTSAAAAAVGQAAAPNTTVKASFAALKNKSLYHPSSEYLIRSESIPGNEVPSIRYHGSLLAYFRHERDPEIPSKHYTQLRVWSLALEQPIMSFKYQWSSATPPPWIAAPKLQVADLALSDSIMAFTSTENQLVFVRFKGSTQIPSEFVESLDLGPIIQHHEISQTLCVSLAAYQNRISLIIQGYSTAHSQYRTILLLVSIPHSLESPNIVHYLITPTLSVHMFSPESKLVCVNPNHYILVLEYLDFRKCTNFKLIIIPTSKQLSLSSSLSAAHYRDVPRVVEFKPHSSRYLSVIHNTKLSYNWKIQTSQATFEVVSRSSPHSEQIASSSLYDLAKSFSTPVFCIVASDTSTISSISSRLNSPWAMPVALMHLLIFLVLFPLLFLPVSVTQLTVTISDNNTSLQKGGHRATQKWNFLPWRPQQERARKAQQQVVLANGASVARCALKTRHYQRSIADGEGSDPFIRIIKAGSNYFAVEDSHGTTTSGTLRLLKFTDTVTSSLAYSKPRTLRVFSAVCYVGCLLVFAAAIWSVFILMPQAKMDLLVQLAICDAASVFLLALCQDLMLVFIQSKYKWRIYKHSKKQDLWE